MFIVISFSAQFLDPTLPFWSLNRYGLSPLRVRQAPILEELCMDGITLSLGSDRIAEDTMQRDAMQFCLQSELHTYAQAARQLGPAYGSASRRLHKRQFFGYSISQAPSLNLTE